MNAIPGICHSVRMTVWYAGAYFLCMFISVLYMFRATMCIFSCIPDCRPHRVTYTRYRIDTVNSPDDGHIVARNM